MTTRLFRFGVSVAILLAAGLLTGLTLVRAQKALDFARGAAVGTAFNFQGRLDQSGVPANGSFDFKFGLYDALAGGTQINGITLTLPLSVTNGIFSTPLDFGAGAFDGSPRYLAIAVKPSGGGSYTGLNPRQPIAAVPYAIYADGADWNGLVNIPADIADGDDVGPGVVPAKVVWVAKAGGDFTSVNAALAAITDASALNPYLVRIAPGIYTETVSLKSYVDIEGSGQGATILRGLGGTTDLNTNSSSATLRVTGTVTSEVRKLTVESDGVGVNYAGAIWTSGTGEGLRFRHVTAAARNAWVNTYGVYNKANATPVMSHLKVEVDGVGAVNSYGIYNEGASPKMEHVAVAVSDADYNTGVTNSGSPAAMRYVTIAASGGADTIGVFNTNASTTTVEHVSVAATGGSLHNYGIWNENSTPVIRDTVVAAAGGSVVNWGVHNWASFTVMDNVTAEAAGTGSDYGVYNQLGSSSVIRDSAITGSTGSVYNDAGSAAQATNSLLGGAVSNGTICLDSHNEMGWALMVASCLPLFGDAVAWGEVSGIPLDIADGDDVGHRPAKVVWVAKADGDFTSVGAALASITDASALNPYLVRVAPGVYTETVSLKSYVDIEGSGQGVTILRGLGGTANPFTGGDYSSVTMHATGTITSEVRLLTVESKTASVYSAAIRTDGVGKSLRFRHVTVLASGGALSENYGQLNVNSSPLLRDMDITAAGGSITIALYNKSGGPEMTRLNILAENATSGNAAIVNDGAVPVITHVQANAKGGGGGINNIGLSNSNNSVVIVDDLSTEVTGSTLNYGIYNEASSSLFVKDSLISGYDISIFNDSSSTAYVVNSYLDETAIGANCQSSSDSFFRPLDRDCQPVHNDPMALSLNLGIYDPDVSASNLSDYHQVATGDDLIVTATMPFSVTFDGVDYGLVIISSNGWIQFTGPVGSYIPDPTNDCLPSSAHLYPFLAAYWDDLVLSGNGLEYGYVGSSPNRVYIINYDAQTFTGSYNTDFQIQIHETSGVLNVRYHDMSPFATGQNATIGYQTARHGFSPVYQAYPITCNARILDYTRDNESWSIAPVR